MIKTMAIQQMSQERKHPFVKLNMKEAMFGKQTLKETEYPSRKRDTNGRERKQVRAKETIW